MKKSLLFFVICFFSYCLAFAQTTLLVEAPQNNLSTTQVRAPNGLASSAYMRACALVLQNELSLIPNGSTITVFGFTLSNATTVSAPVAGNFTVYLENTTDASYLKGTTWSTIISPMTVYYASIMTIPLSASSTSITLTLSSPFIYSGGGIYVAYDWFSGGPFSTANPATYYSESAVLNPGCASGVSASSAPATLGTTNFRPSFLFGLANPYNNDVSVIGLESPGRIASTLNTPHNIKALVKNTSSVTLAGINVSVTVTGSNPFNNTQLIPSLAAGATTMVTFASYNPMSPGPQTVSVTVPGDQVNTNNMLTYGQNVTCDTWGQNPASGSYTYNSVGFAAASGIIATPFFNTATSTLTGLRGAVSTNTPSIGNNIYGVLMSSTGGILATTNTVNLTAPMLGNFASFSFATPVNLSPSTTYYIGFAQTVPGNAIAYYPAGTQATSYLQFPLYYSTGLAGGALTPLAQNFGYFGLEAVFAHTVTISAPAQSVTCGSNATLTALSTTNYSWSTNATTNSIVVTGATLNANYTVTATNTLGCSAATIASLIVTPLPVNATSTPTTVCSGDLVVLTASGASSFTWQTASGTSNGNTISDTPIGNTNYTLTGANPNGCTATNVIPLTVNPLPVVNLAYSASSVCAGSTVYLSASGTAASYSFSTGQISNTVLLTPLTTTVIVVTGTSGFGCIKTASVNMIVDSFTPGITSPTTICSGQEMILSATGASSVLWSNGSSFSSITVTPNISTTYSVTGKGLNGCIGSNSTMVSVNNNPTVTATTPKPAICKGESAVVTASGAASYTWSTGASSGPTIAVTPTTTLLQTYTVTGSDLTTGCTATAQVNLKANTCASLSEYESQTQLSVYPNPTSGKLHISAENLELGSEIVVFNTLGAKIVAFQVNGSDIEIDLSAQPRGCYFVSLIQQEKPATIVKVIRE